ncbi:MAG: 3-hydroxyacyl-CoA dehydrogenase [Pseudomonadota bacterium]
MTDSASTRFACVGGGNVGRAWAIVFARAGFQVSLFDADGKALSTRSMPAIQRSLRDLEEAGLLSDAEAVLARIHVEPSLAEAVANVSYVQESISENLAAKQALFHELGELAPRDAILASSTSAIPGSRFMETLHEPGRCLIVHPVNPPYLIPLVELCPTPWTDPEILDRCRELMTTLGQRPITVQREIPGFVLNRLQFTLLTEALHLVGEGYCTPEDLDHVLTDGLAMRWAFLGPFGVGHLNATQGFQGYMDNLGAMMRELAADARMDYPWDESLVAKIHDSLSDRCSVDEVPERQAWRDREIMALRRHRQSRE